MNDFTLPTPQDTPAGLDPVTQRLNDYETRYPTWKGQPFLRLIAERYENTTRLAEALFAAKACQKTLPSIKSNLTVFLAIGAIRASEITAKDKPLPKGLADIRNALANLFGLPHEQLFIPVEAPPPAPTTDHIIIIPEDGFPDGNPDLEELVREQGGDLIKTIALVPGLDLSWGTLAEYMRTREGGSCEYASHTPVEQDVYKLICHYRARHGCKEIPIERALKRPPQQPDFEGAAEEVTQDKWALNALPCPALYKEVIKHRGRHSYTTLARLLPQGLAVSPEELKELATTRETSDYFDRTGDYKRVVLAAHFLIADYLQRKHGLAKQRIPIPSIQEVFGTSPLIKRQSRLDQGRSAVCAQDHHDI